MCPKRNSWLRSLLGDPEEKKQRKRQMELAEKIDLLGQLKRSIEQLEQQARVKKEELDRSMGPRREVVLGEIQQIIKEINRLQAPRNALLEQINNLNSMLGAEGVIGILNGTSVTEDDVDRVSATLEQKKAVAKTMARAVQELDIEAIYSSSEGEPSESETLKQLEWILGEANTSEIPERKKSLDGIKFKDPANDTEDLTD